MAKSKKGKVIPMLSPENYIRQRSRNLPVHECLITPDWEEDKKASIVITRKHTNGNFTVGFYLVDLLCLGVKDAHFKFNISEYEYNELLEYMNEDMDLERIDYPLAHNIIFAATEFAEEYGFKPHKDFTSTMQYFLEEDNEEVELMEIECGHEDQPMYVRGPYDSDAEVNRILAQLEKTAGEGNFTFIDEMDDSLFDEDDFLDDEDWEDGELKEILQKQSPGYQFKIQIKNISKPPVWRRVIVPSHYTFMFFHMIIQDVFGWWEDHLFSFSPSGYGSYPVISDGDEYGLDTEDKMEASEIRLSDIFKKEGQKFTYIYDFGDDWVHEIILEKIIPEEINQPACIDGKGKCPPEDCGGPWGYANLKEVLSDPAHPEHTEMKEWLELDEDETWDPNEFDPQEVQELLKGFFSLKGFTEN